MPPFLLLVPNIHSNAGRLWKLILVILTGGYFPYALQTAPVRGLPVQVWCHGLWAGPAESRLGNKTWGLQLAAAVGPKHLLAQLQADFKNQSSIEKDDKFFKRVVKLKKPNYFCSEGEKNSNRQQSVAEEQERECNREHDVIQGGKHIRRILPGSREKCMLKSSQSITCAGTKYVKRKAKSCKHLHWAWRLLQFLVHCYKRHSCSPRYKKTYCRNYDKALPVSWI